MKSCRLALLLCLIGLSSACSTYKTSSDIEFDSVWLSGQEPVVHVGDIEATSDKLTYLGWIEAKVSRPSPLHDEPSQQQVDIVLAHEANKLGAHAVTHVTYKRGVLTELTARGQAVLINDKAVLEKMAAAKAVKKQQVMYRAAEVLSPAAVVERAEAPVELPAEPTQIIANPEPEKVLSPAAAVIRGSGNPMEMPPEPEKEPEPQQQAPRIAQPAQSTQQQVQQPTTQAAVSNPGAMYFGPLYQPPSAEKLQEMSEKTRQLMEKARKYRDQEMFNHALELYHFIHSQQSF